MTAAPRVEARVSVFSAIMPAPPIQEMLGGVAATFPMRQRIASLLWAFSLALLVLVVATALLAMSAIALGHAPSPALLWVALVASAAAAGWALRGDGCAGARAFVAAAGIAVLVAGLGVVGMRLQAHVYDHSFDGGWYHQPAVELLAGGWNPWRDVAAPVPSSARIQITHFPKALWLVEATLYRLTDRIESVKAVNGLLLLAAITAATAAFLGLRALAGAAAATLGLLAAVGPIAVTQLPTTLVDGGIGSLWVCGVAALIASCTGRPRRGAVAVLAATCALFPVVKFSGLAAVGFLLLPLAALSFVRRAPRDTQSQPHRDADPRLWRCLAAGTLAATLGAATLGFNPYVTNWLHYGHPLMPRIDGGFSALTAWMEPPSFRPLPPPVKSIASLFARSGHTDRHGTHEAELKAPFTVSRPEIQIFHDVVNPRLGGLGPLFSGALILSLAGFAAGNRPPWTWRVGWIAASLTASFLLAPVGWIARFVPQLWLVPILGVACLLAAGRPRWRALGWVTIAVLAANLALVAVPRYRGLVERDHAIRQRLTALAASEGIVIHIPRWVANRTRLAEAGVDFTEVATPEELPCPQPRVLPGSDDSRYCRKPTP